MKVIRTGGTSRSIFKLFASVPSSCGPHHVPGAMVAVSVVRRVTYAGASCTCACLQLSRPKTADVRDQQKLMHGTYSILTHVRVLPTNRCVVSWSSGKVTIAFHALTRTAVLAKINRNKTLIVGTFTRS